MKFKKINPITPSQRNMLMVNRKILNQTPIIKSQLTGLKTSTGKNNLGRITFYHKGGGHKKIYRKLNFFRKNNSSGIVTSIEYDPNRNANIVSIYDLVKTKYFYMLAPKNLNIGDIVKSGSNAEPKIGHSLTISKIPVGSFIHNVSQKKKKKHN